VTSAVTFVWYRNGANIGPHVGYVIGNLLMFVKGVTQVVPGVFKDAVRPAINEPLWTLPYELWLYVLLALLFLLGGRRTGPCIVFSAIVCSIAWSASDPISDFSIGSLESFEVFRLGSYFLSGAVVAVFWPHLERHAIAIGVAGLIGTFLVRNLLPVDTILHSLTLAAATIGLGSSRVMAWFSKGGDASYGMYVFAWPVQQFALLLIEPFWLSMPAAFLVTTALGYGTWHAFEKRAMAYPDRIAAAFRRMAARQA
jgi:peptidoglycan/LPS O-acetylase OafA/YrhL